MISDGYRKLNAQLHELSPAYGTSGQRYVADVLKLMREHDLVTVLDYGSGKGTLKRNLPDRDVREYDPAIPGKDSRPEPADLIVCTDVLEHVEMEHLDAVLRDLQSLCLGLLYVVVSTVPAVKTLPDGRNAHLVVQSADWWRGKFAAHFRIVSLRSSADSFRAVAAPPGSTRCITTPWYDLSSIANKCRSLIGLRRA